MFHSFQCIVTVNQIISHKMRFSKFPFMRLKYEILFQIQCIAQFDLCIIKKIFQLDPLLHIYISWIKYDLLCTKYSHEL